MIKTKKMNVVIAGATSAIAEQTARLLARQNARFFLLARDETRLRAIQQDLEIRGAQKSAWAVLDFNEFERHQEVFQQARSFLGKMDLFLICYGTLSQQRQCESDIEKLREELDCNFVSAASLLSLAANQMEHQNSGTMVAVTSVAGDRGRQSNYIYGAAKAALTVFLQGLRHRLFSKGVAVITVKPGFVDTPMTAHLPKGVLWAKPERIARGIVRAANRGISTELYLPGFWAWIMCVIRWIPSPLFLRSRL